MKDGGKRKQALFAFLSTHLFLLQASTFSITGLIKYHTERLGSEGVRYNLTEPFWVRFDGTNWYAKYKTISKLFFERYEVYEFG